MDIYKNLSLTLDEIESKNQIILDRHASSKKVEQISLARFEFFSKKLKSIKKNFSEGQVRKELNGEIKLAKLRDLETVFLKKVKEFNQSRPPLIGETITQLKYEVTELEKLIDRLKHFKSSLGGISLTVETAEPKTPKDWLAFHNLSEIIDHLTQQKKVIQAEVHLKENKPITKAQAYAILYCKGQKEAFIDEELEKAAMQVVESSFRKTA